MLQRNMDVMHTNMLVTKRPVVKIDMHVTHACICLQRDMSVTYRDISITKKYAYSAYKSLKCICL